MKVLIIDNYDSFTFNLYQLVGTLLKSHRKNFLVDVYRNDKISIRAIKRRHYNRIILSPGPGEPSDKKYFGVCADVITDIGKTVPVLGICLGLQGIAHYFGGKVIRAKKPMHGKVSSIEHDKKGLFTHVPQRFAAMRYHSLVADKSTVPDCLEVSAVSSDSQEVMGLRHKKYPIEGIQFHPESFATPIGKKILLNFLYNL